MCANILTHLCLDRKRKNKIINQNNNRVQQKILCCDFFLSFPFFYFLVCVHFYSFTSCCCGDHIFIVQCSARRQLYDLINFRKYFHLQLFLFLLPFQWMQAILHNKILRSRIKEENFSNQNVFRSVDCGRCVWTAASDSRPNSLNRFEYTKLKMNENLCWNVNERR